MKYLIYLFLLLSCNLTYSKPNLVIHSENYFLLDSIPIEVTGLGAGEEVELSAILKDEDNRAWKSHAKFKADERGNIDLSNQAPLSGTYSGIDPMGLFWSMELGTNEKNRSFFYWQSTNPMILHINTRTEKGQKLEGVVTRQIMAKGVKKIPVSEDGLDGNLFLPEGEGPFPGIIVLGGSNGGYPADSYVSQFANQGYAALGLAYFKTSHTPPYLVNIPLEYFHKGIDWMKKSKFVNTDHLFAVGTSIGGVAALSIASHYSEIKGVVSFVGRGFIPQALETGDENLKPRPMFSLQGKPLPFLPATILPLTKKNYEAGYFQETSLSKLFTLNPKEIDEIATKVEKIQGPILMIGSLDDRIASSGILCEVAYDRLVRNNFAHPYEFIVYKGIGHLFGYMGLPFCPTTVSTGLYVKSIDCYYNFGGNPKDSAKAQYDSWKRALDFLQKNIPLENAP